MIDFNRGNAKISVKLVVRGLYLMSKHKRIVDLRSDTVTLPTQEMRNAMAEAELGDEAYEDDPSINRLEEISAEMSGKEAGLLVSSGTMGNLVAALAHCSRGDQMIVGHRAHCYIGEMGGASAHGGIIFRLVDNDERGMLDLTQVEALLNPKDEPQPKTGMIEFENTHGSTGGRVLTKEDMLKVSKLAHKHGIPMHVDGARIFNATVALEMPLSDLVQGADTVTFCLSKGLAAPFGSLLCGSYEDINRAKLIKKSLGGGLRQAGVMAAAGIIALNKMVDRLSEDHENAYRLALGLAEIQGIELNPEDVETNQIYFNVKIDNQPQLLNELENNGVRGLILDEGWRFVTHYGIVRDDIDWALPVINRTFQKFR